MAVDEAVHDDLEDGNMQCTNHPYKNNINPGGICAFCLQEKLGKLVSSSFPIAVFPSSSTSSSPSFRSDASAATASASLRLQSTRNDVGEKPTANSNESHFHYYSSRRARIPSFLLTRRNKNKNLKTSTSLPGPSRSAAVGGGGVVYNRSRSTTTPGRCIDPNDADSPRRRGFWSFLYHSRQTNKRADKPSNEICPAPISTAMATASNPSSMQRRENFIVVEENESPDATPFDRKVSRSRSVGCGSRSFSGDFFERLSTGFGDCTLRRVESQREGKAKSRSGQDAIKERVKCGGIFGGFMLAASSSSSSNSYWVSTSSSSTESGGGGGGGNVRGKVTAGGMGHHLAHGRSRSWGWAFASPMRALGKPYSSSSSSSALYPSIKRSEANKNSTPNLNATPSLLAVRG